MHSLSTTSEEFLDFWCSGRITGHPGVTPERVQCLGWRQTDRNSETKAGVPRKAKAGRLRRRHAASATEMIVTFAREKNLATIVGDSGWRWTAFPGLRLTTNCSNILFGHGDVGTS
jgi:hypothetical protein